MQRDFARQKCELKILVNILSKIIWEIESLWEKVSSIIEFWNYILNCLGTNSLTEIVIK